jgi:PKD repeat protein
MKATARRQTVLWGSAAVALLLWLHPSAASAASVSLVWDPNPEADLAGYKVHVGASTRTYTQTIDVGHVTAFTVPNLSDGQTYFFTVTAYDIFANDSGFSNEVSTTIAPSNKAPTASFNSSCLDLICAFINTSVDSDGIVVASSWKFGDGTSSTGQTVSHNYTSAGTYTVTLTVTDNAGATGNTSRDVTVSSKVEAQITLSVTGYKVKGLQKVDLGWNNLTSTNVDIFRNGSKMTTTANDGFYTDNINKRGQGTYTYQICVEGTSICSNKVTVTTFK